MSSLRWGGKGHADATTTNAGIPLDEQDVESDGTNTMGKQVDLFSSHSASGDERESQKAGSIHAV